MKNEERVNNSLREPQGARRWLRFSKPPCDALSLFILHLFYLFIKGRKEGVRLCTPARGVYEKIFQDVALNKRHQDEHRAKASAWAARPEKSSSWTSSPNSPAANAKWLMRSLTMKPSSRKRKKGR